VPSAPQGFAHLDQAINGQFSAAVQTKVDHALAVIRGVHWDGNIIPPVAGVDDGTDENCLGYLDPTTRTLGVHPLGPFPESTFVHEVGHVIDLYGIGGGKFASVGAKEFTAWRSALTATAGYAELRRLQADKNMSIFHRGRWTTRPKEAWFQEQVDYSLEWWELWARAYYQWVVLRSGDPLLEWQLDRWRGTDHEITFRSQWTDNDFAPLAAAIDALFATLGYM
jgi:hypothetical protein